MTERLLRFTLFFLFVVAVGACSGRCGSEPAEEPLITAPPAPQLGPDDFNPPGTGVEPVVRDDREDPVIAWVNNVSIHRADLEAQLESRIESYRQLGHSDDARWRNAQRRNITAYLIEDEVLRQACDHFGIEVTDEELDAVIAADRARQRSEAHFEQYLVRLGIDEAEYRTRRRDATRLERLLASRAEATASDEEVQAYYERFRERWDAPERALVSTITVRMRTEPGDTEAAEALADIEALSGRVAGGEAFAAVAEAHSQSPERMRGGDMGWLMADGEDLEETIREAVFSTPAGTVTDPVRTRLGYQVFYVRDRREAGPRDFDEIEHLVRGMVEQRATTLSRQGVAREMAEEFTVQRLESNMGLEREPSQ